MWGAFLCHFVSAAGLFVVSLSQSRFSFHGICCLRCHSISNRRDSFTCLSERMKRCFTLVRADALKGGLSVAAEGVEDVHRFGHCLDLPQEGVEIDLLSFFVLFGHSLLDTVYS